MANITVKVGTVVAYVLMFAAGVMASRFIFDYLGFVLLK